MAISCPDDQDEDRRNFWQLVDAVTPPVIAVWAKQAASCRGGKILGKRAYSPEDYFWIVVIIIVVLVTTYFIAGR
jgi:hypothetical protein